MAQGEQKPLYHGWIVKHDEGEGYTPTFYAELNDKETGKRIRPFRSKSPAEVIEWWDSYVGKHIYLLETPLSAYRVYTHVEDTDNAPR